MKPEQERLRNLLYETITMLCKNGLSYKRALKVQGLLAVTVDDDDVFIVHLNDRIEDAIGGFVIPVDCNGIVEPHASSTSNASKQLPNVSQGFTGNAHIQQFELFSDHTNAASAASERTESDISQEPLSCKFLKVEPLADDCEENADGMDLLAHDVSLEQTNDEGVVAEAGLDQQETPFGINLACSSSQNFTSAIDYRVVCDSDSEIADVSRKDSGSDVKVTVPVVSSSLKPISAVPDRSLNRGAAVQGNPTFPNLCIDTSLIAVAEGVAASKLAFPKLVRSFLPVVPGFTNQQQARDWIYPLPFC